MTKKDLAKFGEEIKFDQNKDYNYSGFHFFKNGLKPISDNVSFEQWEHCGEWIKRANGAVHFCPAGNISLQSLFYRQTVRLTDKSYLKADA